jgi:hypothetical protein
MKLGIFSLYYPPPALSLAPAPALALALTQRCLTQFNPATLIGPLDRALEVGMGDGDGLREALALGRAGR